MKARRDFLVSVGQRYYCFLGTKCAYMNTCSDCHTLPGCGWCDDGSGTGLGRCMEGGDDGARSRSVNSSDVQCPKERWNFVGCPRK